MQTDADLQTMAAVLATTDTRLADDAECILALSAAGYRALEIVEKLDDARLMALAMRGTMADALAGGDR